MYFPYLRGKQFELIVLRELSQFLRDNRLLSPIIEPVKETTVTLTKSLQCMVQENQNFNLIVNPTVGDAKNPDRIAEIIDGILRDYDNFQPAILIDESVSIDRINQIVERHGLTNLSIICNGIPRSEDDFFTFLEDNEIRYVIINEGISSKRFVRSVKRQVNNKITLTNPFKAQRRNVDYRETDNEFFSDEHLFYAEDGFQGFADFVTIGDEYTESGFLPYAVVIHLTYIKDNEEIWIRHFVSDSNEDTTDVAGKFGEALAKLIRFIDNNELDSVACQEFRELHRTGSYSGLGVIKKLSVKHHLELINNFLIDHQ